MIINIDYGKRTPIYEQIVDEIERLVTLHLLAPGEQIMSIRELACSLSINPNTVKKAYDILEKKNVITTKSTKGTFISNDIENARKLKIDSMLQELENKISELETYGLTRNEIINLLKSDK